MLKCWPEIVFRISRADRQTLSLMVRPYMIQGGKVFPTVDNSRQLASTNSLAWEIVLALSLRLRLIWIAMRLFANWQHVIFDYNFTDLQRINLVLRSDAKRRVFFAHRNVVRHIVGLAFNRDLSSLDYLAGKLVVNGREIDPADEHSLGLSLLLSRGWKMENDLFTKDDLVFRADANPYSLYEIYEKECYQQELEFKGREIVDIGANVGDSCIYFAKKGARMVYGFEPLPNIFRLAVEYVSMNGVSDRVKLRNVAVASKSGTIMAPKYVPERESWGFPRAVPYDYEEQEKVEIPVVSLREVSDQVQDHYLLKIDCEGCEYDLIMNNYQIVKEFENVVLEYHLGLPGVTPTCLVRILKEDFICSVSRDLLATEGIIRCKRKEPVNVQGPK